MIPLLINDPIFRAVEALCQIVGGLVLSRYLVWTLPKWTLLSAQRAWRHIWPRTSA